MGGGGVHRFRPVLAAAAVVALLALVGWLVRPGATDSPAPAATPPVVASSSPSPSKSNSPGNSPSQTPAQARRDGVLLRLAALPTAQRLAPVDPVDPGDQVRLTTPEGVWVISRPDLSDLGSQDGGCVPREKGGPAYGVCPGYSELLLLTPDLGTVIRAFPVPDRPVQWLVLTDEAVYFGAMGDGAEPDSLLGRIDRHDDTLTGRVFPYEGPDQMGLRTFRGWPGHWSNAPRSSEDRYAGVRLEGGRLALLDDAGKRWRTVDPVTLR